MCVFFCLSDRPQYPGIRIPSQMSRRLSRSWDGPELAGQQHPRSNTAYFHAIRNGGNMSILPKCCCAVPVCGDNHLLLVLRTRAGTCMCNGAGALLTPLSHRGVSIAHPSHLLAGCCCDSLVVLPRLSCPRGEATAMFKHKKRLEHTTAGPGCRSDGPYHPPTHPSDSGAHRRGSWDHPLFVITQSWSVISLRLCPLRLISVQSIAALAVTIGPNWRVASPTPPWDPRGPHTPRWPLEGPGTVLFCGC